jgi:molecular chaperone DnaK
MARVIGIDLGTTNSVVALCVGERPEVLINSEGTKTTPSVVFYPPDGPAVVGELAKRQEIINPERTVRSIKRFMGCRWEESEAKRAGIAYPLAASDRGMVAVQLDRRTITPEEISAEILKKMRRAAEDHVGEAVDQAVITVPAYFNDSQRQATKAAAELAGLTVLRIINEPTAAALAYGLGRGSAERVAVFDLGGGTFDISLLELDDDVFEVRATAGDNFLGGDNFDQALSDWIAEKIRAETGIEALDDPQARQRIRDTAEKVKCELSTLTETTINLPFIVADAGGPKHFVHALTRGEFEAIIEPHLQRLIAPCKQVFHDAGILAADVDTVLLVGGSTRIPRVQALVAEFFGREPSRGVNPDEVVALGAAIQASILSGDIQEVLLLDITPLSLGIELEGGLMKVLIPRNSSIPTTASRTFTTTRDNQRAVTVHVLQGERRIAAENRSLAKFRLIGVRPAPKEVPEIEVSFQIDANGILNVSAEDLSTSARQEITVEAVASLSTEEIERMVRDSESHAQEDLEFTRSLEERDQARRLRDRVEAFLGLHSDELPDEDIQSMREAIMGLDLAIQAGDLIGLTEAKQRILDLVQEHSELFYLHTLSDHTDGGGESRSTRPRAVTTPAVAAESNEPESTAEAP